MSLRTTVAESRVAAGGLGGVLSGGRAANLFFDPIQCADPPQGFPCHRRSMRLFQIVELASDMRPTRGLLNATIFVELIEPGVGIGLQRAPSPAPDLIPAENGRQT